VRFPLLAVAAFFLSASVPLPQADEALRIDSPADGQEVAGLVEITGSAAVPQMIRFRVSFAYDPNPTATWFPIAEGTQPVIQGVLAGWDTSGISAGTYALRVEAFFADGSAREAAVGGIRVRRSLPAPATATPEALTPMAAETQPMRRAAAFPAATIAFPPETDASRSLPDSFAPALPAGAAVALAGFVLFWFRSRLIEWRHRRLIRKAQKSKG